MNALDRLVGAWLAEWRRADLTAEGRLRKAAWLMADFDPQRSADLNTVLDRLEALRERVDGDGTGHQLPMLLVHKGGDRCRMSSPIPACDEAPGVGGAWGPLLGEGGRVTDMDLLLRRLATAIGWELEPEEVPAWRHSMQAECYRMKPVGEPQDLGNDEFDFDRWEPDESSKHVIPAKWCLSRTMEEVPDGYVPDFWLFSEHEVPMHLERAHLQTQVPKLDRYGDDREVCARLCLVALLLGSQ